MELKKVEMIQNFILSLKNNGRDSEMFLLEPKNINYTRAYAIFSSIFDNLGDEYHEKEVINEILRPEVQKWFKNHEHLGGEVTAIIHAQYLAWTRNKKVQKA